MMKKLLKCCLVLLFAITLLNAQTVEVVMSFNEGKIKRVKHSLKLQKDGAYRLHIPAKNIPRDVVNLDVHYCNAYANVGEDGYWIMPDGLKGDFGTSEGIYISKPVMTMYGMKNTRSTFVAIVKGLKYEFIPQVEAKNGKYRIFPRFQIEAMYFAPYEDIVIDFYELGKQATYVDMAKAYRKYQLDRGEVRSLRERIKTNKHLEYATKAMFMKLSMAAKHNKDKIEHQTRENEPKLHVYCTFDDSMDLMRLFKQKGVDNVQFCYTGWIQKGHDGRSLEIFPVEEAVGGETKMREAVAMGKQLGFQMTCHIAYTGAFTISNCWDEEYIAKRPDGSLWSKYIWSGGRSYQPCMKRVLEIFVDKDYSHLKDIGIEGIFHLDVNSAIRPPYCCDPRHPQTRQQGADAMNAIHEKSHKYFGGQGSEAGFDHVARTLDFSLYTSTIFKYKPRTKLAYQQVPLWQIVYHGIILSNPFLSSMYHLSSKQEDYVRGRLQLAEYGGRPVIYTSTKSVVRNIDRIAKAYKEFQSMAHLQLEFIENHIQLADGVFETSYSDGTKVIVNYNKKIFKYNNIEIPAEDYVVR